MNKYVRIRYIRIGLCLFIAALTSAAAVTGSAWLACRIQLIPAILGGYVIWLVCLTGLTLVFGRFYCSSVCPLGVLQDAIAWLSRLVRRRKRAYHHRRPARSLRIFVFMAVVLSALFGVSVLLSLSDPYSIFGRMVSVMTRPAAVSIAALIAAAATLAALVACAWKHGRLWCNTMCPAGTALGAMSSLSAFHPDINPDFCTGCGRCESVCKAECIDPRLHTIDLSRCVLCFDCMAACPSDAITYRYGRHRLTMPMLQAAGRRTVPDTAADTTSRREFLRRATLGAGAIIFPTILTATDTPSAPRAEIPPLDPFSPVAPPGFGSKKRFLSHCTGCGSCVNACPSGIIRLSDSQYGPRHALAATLIFDEGFCRYDCTACTKACPTGALTPLTVARKHRSVIGKARFDINLCILYADNIACGRCAQRCPSRAVSIIRAQNGRALPALDFNLCIGCGQCVYVCPAQPKAIAVTGTDSNYNIEFSPDETIS